MCPDSHRDANVRMPARPKGAGADVRMFYSKNYQEADPARAAFLSDLTLVTKVIGFFVFYSTGYIELGGLLDSAIVCIGLWVLLSLAIYLPHLRMTNLILNCII
jgi:hypothetical protein